MTAPAPAADRSTRSSPLADSRQQNLRNSIGEVTGLVTSDFALPEFLTRVAVSAARAIPGADGAGVTLYRTDGADTVADAVEALGASKPFVIDVDSLQYRVVNEGPCMTAARERRSIRAGSLGQDRMWPRFGPRASRLGCNSSLSLPLLVSERVVGTINVYASAPDTFDEQAQELGESFAAPAAVAVHNARLFAHTWQLAEQLQSALNRRPVIDQAVGLIRGRAGGTAEEAFAQLRMTSQREHRPLLEVAERIVENAVGRAAARRRARLHPGHA